MGGEYFWKRQSGPATVAMHVALNVAFPLVILASVGFLADRPALIGFALGAVAPWTAVASLAIAWTWWRRGRSGLLPKPPKIFADVLPTAFIWAFVFACASLVVSLLAGRFTPEAALDGGISAFMAALMSGIAISKQTHIAEAKGEY